MARVLIVEDEELLRLVMAEALMDAGFSVDEATNADDADHLLIQDGYKLLVTDIHMPGTIDGRELAKRAHLREPDLPIIFVTGRPDTLSAFPCRNLRGMTLPKPFALQSLLQHAKRLVEETA